MHIQNGSSLTIPQYMKIIQKWEGMGKHFLGWDRQTLFGMGWANTFHCHWKRMQNFVWTTAA